MFEKALRMKLRFSTVKGNITSEDLWDLNLNMLDDVAKDLHRKLKESEEKSFVVKKVDKTKDIIEIKFEITKHIIHVKLEEQNQKEDQIIKNQKRLKLMSLIDDKEDEALKSSSKEDLQKMLDELK